MEKHINIGGKDYTLTANRKLIKTIYNIAPEFLNLGERKKEVRENVGVELISNLDILFFDMIKIAHPELTKEDSDAVLQQFEDEYSDVSNAIIELVMTTFTEGNKGSAKKKKINW